MVEDKKVPKLDLKASNKKPGSKEKDKKEGEEEEKEEEKKEYVVCNHLKKGSAICIVIVFLILHALLVQAIVIPTYFSDKYIYLDQEMIEIPQRGTDETRVVVKDPFEPQKRKPPGVKYFDNSQMWLPLCVLYGSGALMLVSLARTQLVDMRSKEFFPPEPEEPASDEEYVPPPVCQITDFLEECEKCTTNEVLIMKKPDMFHCKECEICVDGYDSHCGMVGTCIGDKNMRYFIQFLFYSGLQLISYGATMYFFAEGLQESHERAKTKGMVMGGTAGFLIFGFSLLIMAIGFIWNALQPKMSQKEMDMLAKMELNQRTFGIEFTDEEKDLDRRKVSINCKKVCGFNPINWLLPL